MRIIAGAARGRRLVAPRDRSVRPPLDRVREAIFSVLGRDSEGARVLDLFAGVGSFGLEALSRGARQARFVERSTHVAAYLERNISELGFAAYATVDHGDALLVPDLAEEAPASYDLVFIDPPFRWLADPPLRLRLVARVESLLSSPALAPGARTVLRLPSSDKGAPPGEPRTTKEYGESTVLYYTRGET